MAGGCKAPPKATVNVAGTRTFEVPPAGALPGTALLAAGRETVERSVVVEVDLELTTALDPADVDPPHPAASRRPGKTPTRSRRRLTFPGRASINSRTDGEAAKCDPHADIPGNGSSNMTDSERLD
jgi:hypothetical protein